MSDATAISDQNFEAEVLKSDLPTLVDFWAEWCGPCRILAPTIEIVAREFSGRVKVCKMDIDSNPHTPTKYNVRSIPTLILFKDGQPVEQLVGNQPKASIVQAIERQTTLT